MLPILIFQLYQLFLPIGRLSLLRRRNHLLLVLRDTDGGDVRAGLRFQQARVVVAGDF